MYDFVLTLHNYLRWAVLIIGVVALVMAWGGVLSRAKWTDQQRSIGRLFVITFDVQVLVGILLYAVLSPLTTGAFNNFGAAMRNADLRFFLADHSFGMIIAAVLVHIGSSRARKTNSPLAAAIFYTLALVVVAGVIPWNRPLF